jgi:hypothetical protein
MAPTFKSFSPIVIENMRTKFIDKTQLLASLESHEPAGSPPPDWLTLEIWYKFVVIVVPQRYIDKTEESCVDAVTRALPTIHIKYLAVNVASDGCKYSTAGQCDGCIVWDVYWLELTTTRGDASSLLTHTYDYLIKD